MPNAIESGNPGLIASSKSSIASSYDSISSTLETLGRYPEAIEAARLSLEVAEQTNARAQILSALWSLAGNYEDLIESLFEQGDYAAALAKTKQRLTYAEQMLALAEEEIQPHDEPFINNIGEWAFVTSEEQRVKWIRRALETLWLTFNDFNWIFDAQNNIFEAIEYSRKALAVAERLGEPGLMRPPLLRGLGGYIRISNYEQALATQSKLFELAESTDGTAEKISAYTGFGYIYSILGRYPEAVEAYQNAIKTAQSANIKAQETTALNNLAVIYKEQGNYSEALNIHIQNLNITRQLREKLESVDTAESLSETCYLELFNDPYDMSLDNASNSNIANSGVSAALQEESKQQAKRSCIEDTWDSEHATLNNMAIIYDNQGRYQEALALHKEALEIIARFGDENDKAITLANIGSVHLNQGSYQEAIQAFEDALSIHKKLLDKRKIASTLNSLAAAYSRQGQYTKALDTYQQALKIIQELGLKPIEPISIGNIGSIYRVRGEYQKSKQYFEQALVIAEDIGLVSVQASQLKYLGILSADLGNYAESLNYLERSLAIHQETEARPLESAVLLDIGQVKQYQGEFAQALLSQEQALRIAQEIDDIDNVAVALSDLGTTYIRLGQYDQATRFFEEALATFTAIGNVNEKAKVLNYLGEVTENQEKYEEALTFYNQALVIYQQIGNLKGETTSLMNIGFVQNKLGNLSAADKALKKALKIQQEVQARAQEGEILRGLALVQQAKNDSEDATELLQQSLALHRELGDRPGEAKTLSDLGKLHANHQPELATVFLKQAVNTYESIRKENRVLDQDLQSSYTETVADTYRQLADVLLNQGRILEAQRVIELLKIEEIREFTSQTRAAWTSDGIVLTPVEQRIQEAHGSLIAIGQALRKCKIEGCSNEEERELNLQRDELIKEYNRQTQAAADIYKKCSTSVDDHTSLCVEPIDLGNQATKLLETHENAVLVYPLIVKDRLWLLWAGESGTAGRIEVNTVTPEHLADTVKDFRINIELGKQGYVDHNSLQTMQEQSEQLYSWLVRPLEEELTKNNIKHLIFAHDRYTRYIPMAALHDGDNYLIENYAVSTVLSASLTQIDDALPPANQASVLGVGLSEAVAASETIPQPFSALENVPLELDGIVKEDTNDDSGFYPGQIFLNDAFNENLLLTKVDDHQVLHIATHGKFELGQPDKSFILLGSGDPLYIPKIDTLLQDQLKDVHLVVLSACETAYGEEGSDGTEIAGISSYFLKDNRADAVMASLWVVDDASTSLLMQRFYEFLATGELTKAEALQQAQLSLLYNQDVATRLDAVQRAASIEVTTHEGSPAIANTSTAHPYHWAPFILRLNSCFREVAKFKVSRVVSGNKALRQPNYANAF